tara:strand:+ start:318 stop:512 length:195 start_codon:yes stop_codon:yes gene_type:complete
MKVKLVDSLGTDLSVVNAARVSFDKKAQWERNIPAQGIEETQEVAWQIDEIARENFPVCWAALR